MRFMVLVKADTDSEEAGAMPSQAEREAMARFKGELVKAGVLLGGESLHPGSRGARVALRRGRATVVDGTFAATREFVAGFWLWQARSRDEAIEWARRIPATGDRPLVVEIREVIEPRDSGKAPAPEPHEHEKPMRGMPPG